MDETELMTWLDGWIERDAEVTTVGRSVFGQPIVAVHLGDVSPEQMIFTAGIHAREHLTANAMIDMIEYTFTNLDRLHGGVYFVPLVNPDGAQLCLHGTQGLDAETAAFLTAVNGGSNDFSLWKANGRAVDLNCNFPSGFGLGEGNLFAPSPSSYVGESPLSEPETRALAELTERVRPWLTVSLHSKGREIYWAYYQDIKRKTRDYRIAATAQSLTGYALVNGTRGSAGGYKDDCIQSLHIPALTLELFDDSYVHPVEKRAVEEERPRVQSLAVTLSALKEKTEDP